MPPFVPFNHDTGTQNQRKTTHAVSYSIIPCKTIQAYACFEHSDLFKVNSSAVTDRSQPHTDIKHVLQNHSLGAVHRHRVSIQLRAF